MVYAEFVERGTPGAQWVKIDGKDFHWTVPEQSNVKPLKPETNAAPLDGAQAGNFVITFGKYNGKRLEEIGPHDLNNYVNWMRKDAKERNKPLSGVGLEAAFGYRCLPEDP
jgi:hypothetical protein